jgi:hypothetical protein
VYLNATKAFLDSVDKFATVTKKRADKKQENRECDEPCHTPEDAKAFTCVMVYGATGRPSPLSRGGLGC